jgi:hypothetical protein
LPESIAGIDDARLRICRNAVYAHHGRDFADAELDCLFYGEDGMTIRGAEAGMSFVFARNPDYSEALLGEAELDYVRSITALEALR